MSDIKKIIFVSCGGLILVILLIAMIIRSTSNPAENIGLFRPAETSAVSVEDEKDRQKEYNSREPLPENISTSLDSIVLQHLNTGDFKGLDSRLAGLASTYKETGNDALAVMDEIDRYRADIAYALAVSNLKTKPIVPWHFYNPEFLAAAVAYTPISMKYEAMISHESAIMAPALASISLTKSDKSQEELRSILADINLTRSQGNEYKLVAVYDMTLFGYDCEFIAVSDGDSTIWQPHTLAVKDEPNFSVTVALCYELLDMNPKTDLDAIFAYTRPSSQ